MSTPLAGYRQDPDDYDADLAELMAQRLRQKLEQRKLLAHPDPRDPDHHDQDQGTDPDPGKV